MKKIAVTILLVVLSNLSFAQIDTTNWYPLQIGNTWQFNYFVNVSESFGITIEVIGDTVINQKEYFILNSWNGHTYQRVENNSFVYEYSPYTNQEYLRYDFVSPDKSIWNLDSTNGQYGIYESFNIYIQIYGDSLESKVFTDAYIDTSLANPDTSQYSLVDGLARIITKGLGITEYGQGISQGTFVGAIINGDTLGTITSISRDESFEKKYYLLQNYPDPFNPTTIIEFIIPESGTTELLIYNSLGEKVDRLLNSHLLKGSYQIQFDGSRLTSGIYFYVLRTKEYVKTKKMLLLK